MYRLKIYHKPVTCRLKRLYPGDLYSFIRKPVKTIIEYWYDKKMEPRRVLEQDYTILQMLNKLILEPGFTVTTHYMRGIIIVRDVIPTIHLKVPHSVVTRHLKLKPVQF